MKPKRKFLLNQIYFYLTAGCNLRCRHCWIAPKYQSRGNSYPFLSLELFRSIIKQARPLGLSGVKLTGGEPLLHPQFTEIVEEIQANQLRFVLETNGLLLSEDSARRIAAVKGAFVSVSLDGADAQTHEWVRGVSGCFEGALSGIRNLVKAGLKPQIIMTIMRRNRHQIERVVRLAKSVGADSVKFNLVQPAVRGGEMHSAGEALSVKELLRLAAWVENVLSATISLPLYFDAPLAFRPLGRLFGDNGNGCTTCKILSILGVLANGAYALCGIGEAVPELVFGQAGKDSLRDVWDNTPALQRLRRGLPARLKGICRECLMQGYCLGACIAMNYYASRDIWAPFWFCAQAEAGGLFPQSRRKDTKLRTQGAKVKCKDARIIKTENINKS